MDFNKISTGSVKNVTGTLNFYTGYILNSWTISKKKLYNLVLVEQLTFSTYMMFVGGRPWLAGPGAEAAPGRSGIPGPAQLVI